MKKFSVPGASVTHADVIATHDYILVEPTARFWRPFRRMKLAKITRISIRLTHEDSSQSTWTRTPKGIEKVSSALPPEAHIVQAWFGFVDGYVVRDFLTLEGFLSFHNKYNNDATFAVRLWNLLDKSKALTQREFCARVERELARRRLGQ